MTTLLPQHYEPVSAHLDGAHNRKLRTFVRHHTLVGDCHSPSVQDAPIQAHRARDVVLLAHMDALVIGCSRNPMLASGPAWMLDESSRPTWMLHSRMFQDPDVSV